MTAKILPITPFGSARTFRQMAKARHAEAVECLLNGDRDGWSSRRRDADMLEDRARQAQRIEDEQDRRIARGLARMLERSEAIRMAQGRKGRAS